MKRWLHKVVRLQVGLMTGKPGYVFSPFDTKGRYIDVRGYPPGSKAKDPWTDKIFIVP